MRTVSKQTAYVRILNHHAQRSDMHSVRWNDLTSLPAWHAKSLFNGLTHRSICTGDPT
jgi:hypothetical protein